MVPSKSPRLSLFTCLVLPSQLPGMLTLSHAQSCCEKLRRADGNTHALVLVNSHAEQPLHSFVLSMRCPFLSWHQVSKPLEPVFAQGCATMGGVASLLLKLLQDNASILLPDAEVVSAKSKRPALVLVGKVVAHVIAGAQLDCDSASITVVLSSSLQKASAWRAATEQG